MGALDHKLSLSEDDPPDDGSRSIWDASREVVTRQDLKPYVLNELAHVPGQWIVDKSMQYAP